MHRGVSFLLASLLPLLVLSTKPLSLLPGDDIYYLLNEQQLAFLTPSRTALVTFPPTASVADVVRSSLIAKLAPNARGCEVTTVRDKIRSTVAATSVMASVLTSSPSCVSITCGQQSFMLTEVVDTHSKPYVPPQFETAEERNKYANEIKQQYDALQKERLSVERDWPYTLADIIGTNIISDLEWAIAFLSTHWGDLHPFPDYAGSKNDTGVYFLNDGSVLDHSGDLVGKDSSSEVRISIAADWGAGTMESQYVSNLMVAQFKPHYTLHLGDIYYVGSEDEMKSNVLGVAPVGAKNGVRFTEGTIGSFATPGNHEMYSRGFGFFDTWLPVMGMKDAAGKAKGQQASYFMFENEYWRIISLDTGYLTYSPLFENDDNKQPDAVIDWLKNVVNITNVNDKRGLIFVSHHQYRSAFGSQYLSTPKQLDELVPKGRKVLWLYGHEHRLSFYNCNSTGGLSLQAFTRCIGVGGFPVSLSAIPPYAREQGLEMFDDRQYTVIPGYWDTPVGFNGFTLMKFTKDVLRIEYRSLMIDEKTGVVSSTNSTLLVDEAWGVDKATGNVVHNGYPYVNSNMTFVTRE